jgi:anti-anti-sigma regulatory factor
MLLEGRGAQLIVCDVSAVIDPDAATIDALARVQLTARRLGGDVRLRNACDQLRDLVTFVGLADVVPVGAAIRLEPRRQAEEREQARGVEEEADPDDRAG